MTLEQAVERLQEKRWWFEGHVPPDENQDGLSWFVWCVTKRYGLVCKGEGKTWQEAYAEAMGEAPF